MKKELDITSTANPFIKWARSLHQAKYRRKHGVIIVEGMKEITLAIQSGLKLKTLFVQPDIFGNHDLPAAQKTLFISKNCFEQIAYRENSGGLVAVFEKPEKTLDNFKLSENPLILVLESVEKPGNLGAIMRVADGAGVDGVIICDEHTDIWNPNAIRASIGTIFSMQLAVTNSEQTYTFLKQNNINLFAAEVTNGSKNYADVNFKNPSAIILGTEAASVSNFWLEKSQTISLPMLGANSSLNVSTAAAVLAYEAMRQRQDK